MRSAGAARTETPSPRTKSMIRRRVNGRWLPLCPSRAIIWRRSLRMTAFTSSPDEPLRPSTMSGFATSMMRPRTSGWHSPRCRHRAAAARRSITVGSFSITAASARTQRSASRSTNSMPMIRRLAAGRRSPKRLPRFTPKARPWSATPPISWPARRAAAAPVHRSRFTPSACPERARLGAIHNLNLESTMQDAPAEAHEHMEHALQAEHATSPFVSRVTITIASLAVLAAVAGSLETLESGEAVIAANSAVLDQDRATDSWNLYEARSIKKYMLEIASGGSGPEVASYREKAKSEESGETEAEATAKQQETQRDRDLAASDTL